VIPLGRLSGERHDPRWLAGLYNILSWDLGALSCWSDGRAPGTFGRL
jgi:hypothetical protein